MNIYKVKAVIMCLARIALVAAFCVAVYRHDWITAGLALIAGVDVKIDVK
jgi:hypothetical protein